MKHLKIYSFKTVPANEDHVIWSKAPGQVSK